MLLPEGETTIEMEENRRVAVMIAKISEGCHGYLGKGGNNDNSKTVRFRNIHRPEVTLSLHTRYGRPAMAWAPEGFTLPNCSFHYNPPKESGRYTTPFGIMPASGVIGADDIYYTFGAAYYFSESGQGIKEEYIYTIDKIDAEGEENLHNRGIFPSRIGGSNLGNGYSISTSEGQITEGDRELVWSILHQIVKGEFVEY